MKSTFPNRKMNEYEIRIFLKNNEELIILSSYAKCGYCEISDLFVKRVFCGVNEYGGNFDEYWVISKRRG